MIYGPVERAWLRYWERRDWLTSVGCCAPCAMALALEPIAAVGPPWLPLPCAQPLWHRGKCVEWARAAWVERVAEQQQPERKAA